MWCYPGFCNPPLVFPPAEPGPEEAPTPLRPYLPGIPPHESGALHAIYRGFGPDGEPGDGQQLGPLLPTFFGTNDPDSEEIDWDLFDSMYGGNAAERILDTSLFDSEGNPLIDIEKNFSFWANSGRLSDSIPAELRDDPNYLKDFRIPNKINEANFINESNLECIPYPDSLGREFRRSPDYTLNSANLTILDAELADGSGRTIEYATGHADIYYIVLSDGTTRAMSYRVADSDSLVWYPARGPIDRDVTQTRIGLIGENSLSVDREAVARSKVRKIKVSQDKTSSKVSTPVSPPPSTPVSRPVTPPSPPPPPPPPPAPPTPPPSSGGYGY